MKEAYKRVIDKAKPFYLVFCFISYILIDWILRATYIVYGVLELYDWISLFFVLGWCFLLCGIISMLPAVWKKIFMALSIVIYSILTLIHGAYINVFGKFFSFADLSLLQEGMDFMAASYIDIRKRIIACVLISVFLMIFAIYLSPGKHGMKKKDRITGVELIALGIIGICAAKIGIIVYDDPAAWDATSQPGVIYEDFLDTTRSLLICGLYEYTSRDVWILANPFDAIRMDEKVAELDQYFESRTDKKQANEKTGIFKDRNLMLIQLENIDTWMLTEQNMPNMYRLKEEGIDFTEHYSVGFATGKTFNTEFIANTGFVPQTKGKAPSHIYSKNYYPYSLPNLFKEQGYTANSYHAANGAIYNRENVHHVFGYEKYHNWEQMGMEDYTMDSQMLNQFEVMVPSDKFFDFIITYSGHGPFSLNNAACKAHIDEVRAENNDPDKEYLYGLAQAKETDLFVEDLLNSLEEYGLLEDTVLIFYTDHYAYSMLDEEKELELKGTSDLNLIQKTPFFIWSAGIESEKIEKVTDTTDILPTIANLFGLDCEYKYWVGEDIFGKEEGYAPFSDFSWYDGAVYYNSQYEGEVTEEIKRRDSEIEERIRMSWELLEADYFERSEQWNE